MLSTILENTFFFILLNLDSFDRILHQSADFSTIRKLTSPFNPLKLNSRLVEVEHHDNNATEVEKNCLKCKMKDEITSIQEQNENSEPVY